MREFKKKIISVSSVKEGDKLTVRFTDVGEGWLQCEDAQGQFSSRSIKPQSRDPRINFKSVKEIPVWSLKHMLSYRMTHPLHQHQHQILNFQMTIGEMCLVPRTHLLQVTFYSINTVVLF